MKRYQHNEGKQKAGHISRLAQRKPIALQQKADEQPQSYKWYDGLNNDWGRPASSPSSFPSGGTIALKADEAQAYPTTNLNLDFAKIAPMTPSAGIGSLASGPPIQAELSVNAPDDQYEQEADQVAEAVMRMPDPTPFGEDMGGYSSTAPNIHRLPSISPIQANGNGGGTVSPDVEANINNMKGGGQALPDVERQFFESRMGADFSDVRVHTDANAVQTSRDINARAFTVGSDIAFNEGEYRPGTDAGRRLLGHELTHTVQQGEASNLSSPVQTNSNIVQRYVAPEQTVTTESKPQRPDDGSEVEGRMNQKIENDPNVQDKDDLSEEERKEAENPDRGEVRQKSGEISGSGESSPAVDRGEIAQEKTETQKTQLEAELNEESPEAAKEEKPGEEKTAELSEAEAAAQRAEAATQQAQSVEIPEEPEPFNHPEMEAPVDSAGESLPRNSQIDTQVRGLGYIGEMLRTKGYEMKESAAQQEMGAYEQESVVEQTREDLANAQEGTSTMETHNQAREEIAQQSQEAHIESVERQEFVAEKAPELSSKANEGKEDSGELASESQSKAERSQSEIPDDPDAKADAEQQSAEMQDSADQTATLDDAIIQTGERADQYEQDAEEAAEQNEQSQAQITETEEVVEETNARIEEMHATNEESQEQIENAAPGPELIKQFSQETAQSGDELIAASIVMEDELNALQDEYLSDMAAIESREEAEERLKEEQEQEDPAPDMSPEDQQLFELAGMSDEEQEQCIAQMDESERTGLLATLDNMIAQAPDQGTDATEGARLKVDTGLTQAIMGEQPDDPRAQEIQEVENRRIERVGGVLDIADQNMGFLTEAQQQMLANRLVAESITDDIANINVLQMGKEMLKGMIDPRQSLVSVVGGFEKTLTGFANLGNAEAWRRDPVGNLLQSAADITTGLAMIFSSVLGIAALITALMVALTIASFGFASPVTGPVIGWMGTIMTYAGWGAIISGSLAVYFNYLTYIKNLHDAGTAETARELFGNTEQMKQNASDGFQGAMAVVEGVGAVKMGPQLTSGEYFSKIPKSPGQWAKQTVDGVKDTASSAASAPGRIARGARELFEGGTEGLKRFKERVQNLFKRNKPGDVDADLDLDTPEAKKQHQDILDETHKKQIKDMDETEFQTEMQELGQNKPQKIDPDSEYAQQYDIEIESNGHTYRRNKDGSGWCRFSKKECGIPEDALPDEVQQNLPQNTTSQQGNASRPSPRQSEIDALSEYPDFKEQVSFIDGQEVKYGTKSSSRPDGFNPGPPPEALEVKNYNVSKPENRASLYETIKKQYQQRLDNLPEGTTQTFILDIRGQTVSDEIMGKLKNNILNITGSDVKVRFLM